MHSIIIGGGTDAGGWIITFEHGKVVIKRIPGWNPEQFAELGAALNIIREATKLKTPGLAEAAALSVMKYAQDQLGQHVKGNAVFIAG
jgi:RimJ/RimL family protein N-acetyltransferase